MLQPCYKLETSVWVHLLHTYIHTYIHTHKCIHTHAFYIFAGESNDNSDLGVVIGGVISGVVGLLIVVLIIAVVYFCIKTQPCNRNPLRGRDYGGFCV